jgi:hypothetical protein
LESTAAVGRQQLFQTPLLLGRRERAPVLLLKGHGHTLTHDLKRFITALPQKRRPQDGVAVYHLLPAAGEGRHVERPLDGAAQLLEVLLRLRVVEGVEEHPLLQGRQRVDGFDVILAHTHVT